MGGFWINLGLLSILITTWETAAITNNRRPQQGGAVRDFRHIAGPSSANINTDWEVGLREATNQALLREGYQEPNLRDRIFEASLIGRQDTATPFGDIAVLARGQLYIANSGNFAFVQDPYQNDCDNCHNVRSRCTRSQCKIWNHQQNEHLVALWTVKRLRHRDFNNIHRYELEYTISPIDDISRGLVTRNGNFDYAIPGHVFVVKNGERQPTELHPTIIYNKKIPHRHFKPEVLISVSPDGRKHILHSYPGFYTSFPVHPTYHQQGYRTNDPKEIELYKELIESLAAKTSTTQKVENGPHRFSLNQYGGIPEPNKVHSTKPSYDSFLSSQTPLAQLPTGQVVPLTEITLPITNTQTYTQGTIPTPVYQPNKETKPIVLSMVPTTPTDLNMQEVYPQTEGAYPPTRPEVTQPIKTTIHYYTPIEEHLLTTDTVKEIKMAFQPTVPTKETTSEYKPSTRKPTSTSQKEVKDDFLFPVVEKSTRPLKTTKKYNIPTTTVKNELDFLFPIEQVTATSKETKQHDLTVTATYSEPQFASSTHKISTTRPTTVKIIAPKINKQQITTPKTTTLDLLTSNSAITKQMETVIITTKIPTIIKLTATTSKTAKPKPTITKSTSPKKTSKITIPQRVTTKTTTVRTTTTKLTTNPTPKFSLEISTPKTSTYKTNIPTTTNKSTTQKLASKFTTPKLTTNTNNPKPTSSKTTTIKSTTTKTTSPKTSTSEITSTKSTTTKTTTPKTSTSEMPSPIPTMTKPTTLKLTTTVIPTQTPTATYPTTNFVQKITVQQEEITSSDEAVLPEVGPTKPMKAITLEPRPESINQLQSPANDSGTTVPVFTTIAAIQETQKSTRNEVETTKADASKYTLIPNETKTTIPPTMPYKEETVPRIVTQTEEHIRKTTDLTTATQTDSTTEHITMTMSLTPTLQYSTTTQQYTETTRTPDTTGISETTSETNNTTTINNKDNQFVPTTSYTTSLKNTKPTITKMWSTSRATPALAMANDFLSGKPNGPSYTNPMKADFDEDDIFGRINVVTRPTMVTTKKVTESELADELFGDQRQGAKRFKTDTTAAKDTKIIYSNFFEPSTTAMSKTTEDMDTTVDSTELYKTTMDLRPLTSQSYATSISFEVKKKNKTNLVDNIEYDPAIVATISEVMNDDKGYTVYKAELPTDTSTVMTESTSLDTRKAFDDVALQLVNHARSISMIRETKKDDEGDTVYKAELPTDMTKTTMVGTSPDTKKAFDDAALQLVNHARSINYLSVNKNRTNTAKYKRRRNYIPKSRRTKIKRKN